jgi:hypothetical protein
MKLDLNGRENLKSHMEIMFVTIQRENIRPSRKEISKAVTILKLPDVCG